MAKGLFKMTVIAWRRYKPETLLPNSGWLSLLAGMKCRSVA